MLGRRASSASVSGERCERLAATRSGAVAGVRVRSGESVKEVIACPDAGYFFQNVVS